jgi:hypothetical protein
VNLPDPPIVQEGFFAARFFTVSDQDKSKDFCVRILGGRVIKPDNPCYIKPANTWITLNSGGGPPPDEPGVLLETPPDLNRVNGFTTCRHKSAHREKLCDDRKNPGRDALLAARMLTGAIEAAEDDEESERRPAVSGNSGCRPGQLWLLGHRVLCIDATSAEAVTRLVRGAISDALFSVVEVRRSTAERLSPESLNGALAGTTVLSSAVTHPERVPDSPGNGRTADGVNPPTIVRSDIWTTPQAFTLSR